MTAVIADDNVIQQGKAELALRKCGVKVIGICASGEQALAMIRALRPDLAVLDYIMTPMNGAELAQKIHNENLGAKVIMATSMSQEGAVYNPDLVGIHGIVIKPYSAVWLKREIDKVFNAVC